MDIAKIKQQIYAKIPTARDKDIAAALDMFLHSHKVTGVLTDVIVALTDYDETNKCIALPSAINEVSAVYVNDTLIPYTYNNILSTVGQNAYYTGEDGTLYFNFELDKDNDQLKVRGKVGVSSIADYEDKWFSCCVHFLLKELYQSEKYLNVELFKLSSIEYDKQFKLCLRTNRQKLRMSFMNQGI